MKLLVALSTTLLLVTACLAFASAQPGQIAKRCNLFDANGFPTAEALRKHGPHLLGLSTPGWMYHLNYTVMEDVTPGQTTFTDEYSFSTYQFNSFVHTTTGCGFAFDRFVPRAPGHYVLSKWFDDIQDDQTASQAYAGTGRVPLGNSYTVQVLEPIIFEERPVTTLKLRMRAQSSTSSLLTFNYELPDGTELPIYDEMLAVTPLTLARLQAGITTEKEFYYSISVYQGAPNGFVDWAYIFRKEKQCAGATGALAEACECYQRLLSGTLTLENDPLAAAAGHTNNVLTCKLSNAKLSAAAEVRWPNTPLARATYSMGAFPGPLRYVPGMPATREEHEAAYTQ